MDYDDNDFQSQNLHLAGEGSTKFPPVLRPYALPKFDFDESLQGQLRFDNLVETEVFLGIESNEDSQWIDAYSRGSSGIGFSSTAAESCSISRHNNVWSEATSSESVEMLLKSVGQEEYIPRQSVIQESDACNELACLAKQMESNLKADDKNESRDVAALQLSDNLHEDGSGLKKNGRRDQPQVGVSQAHENELSFDGSSGNLELSDICENIDPPQSEGIYFTDTKGKNEKQQEVEAVGDDPLNDRILDDSSASGELQTNVTAAPMQNISSTSDSLDVQNVQNQVVGVSGEQQGCLTSQTDRQDTESYTFNKGTNVDTQALDGNEVVTDTHNPDNSVCLSSKEEDLNGESVVKGLDPCLTNVDGSLGVVPSNVSDLQKAERCSEDVDYRNACLDSAGGNAVKDAMKDDQSALTACNSPKVEVKGNTGLEEVIEINNSNFGISPNLQQCVDYVEKKTHGESSFDKEKESLNSGHEMDMEVSVSKAEASSTVEGGNISKTNEHDDSKVEGISCFSMVSTTKSCILGESTQVCEGSEVDKLDDKKFHQDMSIADQDFTRAPSDCSQINRDADEVVLVDKGIDSSSISPGGMETGLSTSSVSTDVTAVDNSASKALSDVSFASSGTVDVQPCHVSTQKVTDQNDVQRKTSPVGSNPVDEKEDSAARVAEEAHLSRPIVSSEQGTIPGPVIETERQSCDTSRQLSWETVDNCTKIVEIYATGNVSEPPKTMNHNQESAKEMDVCSTVHKPTAKQDEVNPPSKILGGMLLSNQGSGSSAPLSDSHVELHEPVGGPAYSTCSPSITAGRSSKTEKDGNQNPPLSELINKDATNVLLTDDSFKGNDASKDKGSLTPELNTEADLSKNNAADSTTNSVENSQPVPATRASKASTVVEVSPSGLGPSKIKTAGDTSHGSPQISDGEIARSISKSTPQRKTRRTSSKTAGKESSRKVSHVKETPPARQPERADKSNNAKLSSPPGFQLMQSNEMLQYGHIDSGSAKPFALLNASTASLPDLNTSASSPVLFQQPFTDLQQIQLRAQIFVYGALIQGIAPDEAYMISAFGGPDGGRILWENVWRVCVERQHSQKSLLMNPETPVQTRSGSRASELAKQGSQQSKGVSSPLGRSSSKATPAVVNPLIPLSSPLWNLPTPSDSLQPGALIRGSVLDYPRVPSSLHTYQTPPVRNILGHNTSWISQAPVRSPWIASPAPDTSSLFSASPISDSVKLNSVKGSSLPPSSGIKSVTPGLLSSSAAPQSIFVGTAPLHDTNSVTVSPPPHSSDPKPKRRKKVTISEDLGQKALQTQPQLELNSVVSSHLSTSVVLATTVGSVPKTTVEKSIVSLSSLSPADHLKIDRNIEKRLLSDESLTKVKEAGAHAEEAAALSAAAVNHSLEIWTQLDKQKNSGLVSVIEAELASAAVTVAAAAAVAKAAAAAAKVASNAALQAKLMAEEALASSSNEGTSQSNGISHSEGIKILGKATPASILKGPNGIGSSSSIIVAAKEVSRRRVEAASAAAKQAENMDAIVKAAELAAEAVSQAGKIVTMGDPLHISNLVEAGPQGRWEAAHDSSQQVGSSKSKTRGPVNIDNVGDNATISHTLARNIPSDGVGMKVAASEKSPLHKGYDERSEDHTRPMDESEIELHDPSFVVANGSEKLGESSIKEGSLVEVFKDGGEGCQAAWFTANVLSLNDGKAYVCYSVLVAEGGAGPLKEWVPLESEGDKPPKIRIARPLAGTSYEGTRKRRRAATRDYACSVGHRVDVWIQESWQEGIVKENKKDEITVDFPARGETVVVRAWQVRSSLFWKDGKWIEYSSLGANVNSSHEGDTPREKRPKLGGPTGEAKGKDKMLKSIEGVEPADPNKLRLLDLSEKEKVFNVGKNSKNEIKTDTQRMPRTGLQKEGSRVIFGVPKPGKKRKFMEVSKHYVADRRDKVDDGNESVKLANFLMPQGPAFRGWKNNAKNDTKEKRGAISKSKTVKSGKPGVLGKPIPPKDSPSENAFSLPNDLTDHKQKIKDSESENHAEMASYSANDGAAEGPILYPPLATSSDAPSSNRTTTSRASKGKLAPAGGKLGKIEEEKPTTETSEPRRSNRRIQPTSRLLEGLQSYLIISKIPSVSHDKGHKNQNRNASRGNNQG